MAVTGTGKKLYWNCVTCGEATSVNKADDAGAVFGVATSGTDGDENLLMIDGQALEYHIIATNSLVGFAKVATGIRCPVDATDNDGIEISGGIMEQDKLVFTVGTDPAFHMAVRFNASVANAELLGIGFRNVGAYIKHQSGVFGAGITDLAYIGVYGSGATTAISTVTELNSGGMSAIATTEVIVATTPFEFRVNVSAAGVVTFQNDLAAAANPATAPTLVAPEVTQAFTFDTGDVITPFIIILKGATAAGNFDLLKVDIGHDAL
jgi:hypothetical protein